MSLPEFKTLIIDGPVSVLRVTGKIPRPSYVYLIMGPTGAGKSSFIEALAGDSNELKISGDQLASVTQSVTAYRLVNVTRKVDEPVYIIDTPGFSDSKISEGEIIGMVDRWREETDATIDFILFLTPITATRIAGTKRRTLKMMKELMSRPRDLIGMIFVTTMWDQVCNESAKQRVESNFTQLEKDILKGWIDKQSRLTKFDNDQSSALEALDNYYVGVFTFCSRSPLLYHDLYERISMALQEKQMIKEQLNTGNPHSNKHLKALYTKNKADNEDLLVKLIGQLQQYEEPPEGYESAHTELTTAISDQLGDEIQGMQRRVQKRRELERGGSVRGNLGLRVLQKIEETTTSFTGFFKRTS